MLFKFQVRSFRGTYSKGPCTHVTNLIGVAESESMCRCSYDYLATIVERSTKHQSGSRTINERTNEQRQQQSWGAIMPSVNTNPNMSYTHDDGNQITQKSGVSACGAHRKEIMHELSATGKKTWIRKRQRRFFVKIDIGNLWEITAAERRVRAVALLILPVRRKALNL